MNWWQTGVIYQIYPRSFYDSNQDGIGDIRGIIKKISYFKELGVDILWLSPIFLSPNDDFGYDIADYTTIAPEYGTMDDFDELITIAHEQELKILIDGVFNHTSVKHSWFLDALEGSKRDWYHFCSQPNNWTSAFGGGAWTYLKDQKKYYLHTFLPSQADLNWAYPPVQKAILDVMHFWLKRGVDGFRLDVFNCYHKDINYSNNPFRWNVLSVVAKPFYPYLSYEHLYCRDQPQMFETLFEMRKLCDSYNAVLLGETLDEQFQYKNASQYCGGSKLHMAFHFRWLHSKWSAMAFRNAICPWIDSLPSDGWPTWVVSNHDFVRHASRWKGRNPKETEQKMKIIAVISLTLRGTPSLYYGEEIGMEERVMKRQEIQDPVGKRYWPFFQGRDGARTPMQWDTEGGFTNHNTTWIPYGNLHTSVFQQQKEPQSLWNHYRLLLSLRKRLLPLHQGTMNGPFVCKANNILYFERSFSTQTIFIFINMSGQSNLRILLSKSDGEILFSCGDVLQFDQFIQIGFLSTFLFEIEPASQINIQDLV